MKNLIFENEVAILWHHVGETVFRGCQCFKYCNCNEMFKPLKYDYYTVFRKNKRTTNHETLEEAIIRFNFITDLCTIQ